jgi:hypothetical protein
MIKARATAPFYFVFFGRVDLFLLKWRGFSVFYQPIADRLNRFVPFNPYTKCA